MTEPFLCSMVGGVSHVVLRVITGWVQSPVKNSCLTMGYQTMNQLPLAQLTMVKMQIRIARKLEPTTNETFISKSISTNLQVKCV